MRWRVIPLAGRYLSPITTTLKKDFNRTPRDARRGRNSSVLIRSPVWLDRFSHKSDITSPQGTPAGHKSFIRSIRIYVYIYIYTARSIQAENKMETGRSRGCWITARRGDLGVLIRGGYRGGGAGEGGRNDYTCESNELRWNEGVRMQAGRRWYRSDMNSWYPELRLDRKLRRSTVFYVHVLLASAANGVRLADNDIPRYTLTSLHRTCYQLSVEIRVQSIDEEGRITRSDAAWIFDRGNYGSICVTRLYNIIFNL